MGKKKAAKPEIEYIVTPKGRTARKPLAKHQEYIDCYNGGMVLEEIAKKYGVKPITVRIILYTYTDYQVGNGSGVRRTREEIEPERPDPIVISAKEGEVYCVEVEEQEDIERFRSVKKLAIVKKIYPHIIHLAVVEEIIKDGQKEYKEIGYCGNISLTKWEFSQRATKL